MARATVDDAVLAIRRAVQEAGEDYQSIGQPADLKQVEWFGERLLKWRWPPSYLGVIGKHDGVTFVTPIVYGFLRSIEIFLVFRDDWYRERRRWPVGGDGCGSYWVLELDQQGEDGECPVRFIDHEDGFLSNGRFAGETYADFVVGLFNECRWGDD